MGVHISTEKHRKFDPALKKWSNLWEGRRTYVGPFCVYAIRSGPIHTSEAEAKAWAQKVRCDGEDSSQTLSELSPPEAVKLAAKKERTNKRTNK